MAKSDNSPFSEFLTSFLSHFQTSQKKVTYIFKNKQILRKKNILRFFTRKIKQILFQLLFSNFIFLLCHQTSPILGSILHIIFNFNFFLYFWGKYVIYCKKKKFLSPTQFALQSSEKVTFIEGEGVVRLQASTVQYFFSEQLFFLEHLNLLSCIFTCNPNFYYLNN